MANTVNTGDIPFQNKWAFGKSGAMVVNAVTQKRVWKDPTATCTVSTINDFISTIAEILDKKYNGYYGVFFGKIVSEGSDTDCTSTKQYLPSIESLAQNDILYSVQNIVSFPQIKTLDDFKKSFVMIMLSIMSYTVDKELYDGILSIEFRQRKRKDENGQVHHSKEIVLWTTREITEYVITENIKKILNCEDSNPTFYVSESLDFNISSKHNN